MKFKFLLDANLSPKTASFLRSFGFDAKSLIEEGLGAPDDIKVSQTAKRQKRLLITFDLDFGAIHHFSSKKKFGVIILRIEDQRVETVNEILHSFLKNHIDTLKKNKNKLIVISETNIRIAD